MYSHAVLIFLVGLAGLHLACDLAFMDNNNPVGQGNNLLQLGGYQQNAGSVLLRLLQGVSDRLNGSDINASCRLGSHQQLLVHGNLSGHYNLLGVSS